MFWNVRAIPRPATTSGRRPMSDSPFHLMSPRCGRYTWLIVLKIDVLPAPLGPMMANSSPGWTLNDTSSIAITPPNRNPISSTSNNGSAITRPPTQPAANVAAIANCSRGRPLEWSICGEQLQETATHDNHRLRRL